MAAARLVSARRHAINQSLFSPTTLQAAVDGLGFVQADPIRSPARAQDLILRHRVEGYRAGDLERQYESLEVEEDYLYAYGFLSRPLWRLAHPRKTPPLRALEKRVLEVVGRLGEAHPRVLESHLGKRRVVNAWGGYSKATTHALEWLHWRGLVRIVRRENGIRVYRGANAPPRFAPSPERLLDLVMAHARIFAPSPEQSLHAVVSRFRDLGKSRWAVSELLRAGRLCNGTIDGVSYLWPAGEVPDQDVPRVVRFLAPFDPVIWDRRRFEHLWGWQYRFEAYTPAKKRVRGYYAMPMLWGDECVGWANATAREGHLDVEIGFVTKRPRGRDFTRELEAEIARLHEFMTPRASPATAWRRI
jgi:uncharacterized protein YcaQ